MSGKVLDVHLMQTISAHPRLQPARCAHCANCAYYAVCEYCAWPRLQPAHCTHCANCTYWSNCKYCAHPRLQPAQCAYCACINCIWRILFICCLLHNIVHIVPTSDCNQHNAHCRDGQGGSSSRAVLVETDPFLVF